jgi:serine/threonine protein kinase
VALSSVVAGTPGFMPPEKLFNRPLTTASDLYGLGATTIALLTNISAINISNLIDENYQFTPFPPKDRAGNEKMKLSVF